MITSGDRVMLYAVNERVAGVQNQFAMRTDPGPASYRWTDIRAFGLVCSLKYTANNTFRPPHFSRRQFPIRRQASQLRRRPRPAGRPVIRLSRTQDKIPMTRNQLYMVN